MRRCAAVIACAAACSLAGCSGDKASSDSRRIVGYTPQRQPVYASPEQQAALERRDAALKVAGDVRSGKKRVDQLTPGERALLASLRERE